MKALMNRQFIIDDEKVDKALSLPFLALAMMSFVQLFLVESHLLVAQLLLSVPLNLLAAYSFWIRRPAMVPTFLSEVLVPAMSFLMPFVILNLGLVVDLPYSLPFLFPVCLLGLAWALVSMFYLRRSFAVLPTVRGVVKEGPYKLVRHPLYLGEALYLFGAMMLAFGPVSLALFALTLVLLKMRIDMEERKMMTQAEYREYRLRVRYRLIPFVF